MREKEWTHNSQESINYCSSSILSSSEITTHIIGYVFWSSSSMLYMQMSRCQIVSFLLINLSSSFDNNNNDCIIKWPVGNRRLKFLCVCVCVCDIHSHAHLSILLVYVWRLEQRWKDWLVIRRRVFIRVHKWPFPVLAIDVYCSSVYLFLNNPWGKIFYQI